MRWFHTIQSNELIGERRGIIVERDEGVLVSVFLLVSLTGRWPRPFLMDYDNAVAVVRPVYWAMVEYGLIEGGRGRRGWHLRRGVKPEEVPLVDTHRTVRLRRVQQ